MPARSVRLNFTVGGIPAGNPCEEFLADRFRFCVGVPRTYDGVEDLRTFVQPSQWQFRPPGQCHAGLTFSPACRGLAEPGTLLLRASNTGR